MPPRRELRLLQLDHPVVGNVEMADVCAVHGIGMLRQRLMSVNFGTVMVPVAVVLVRSCQMCMRRRPLHRHEDSQQNEIGRGANAVFEQEDGRLDRSVTG